MTLLAHFVRTDFRHFRWPLAAWVAVAVTRVALDAVAPAFDYTPVQARVLAMGATSGTVAEALLMLALVASVVQAHPLVGSTAFWMTRPVRWDVLLSSKLALLGILFVAVRVVGEAAHMAAYDVPIRPLVLGLAHVALLRGVALLVIAGIAAITPNLARFALVCGVLLLLAALGTVLGGLLAIDSASRLGVRVYEPGTALASIARERVLTHQAAAAAAALLASLAALVVQYRSRSVLRSAAMFAAGAAIVAALATVRQAWPVPSRHVTVPEWTSEPDAARLQAEEAFVRFNPMRYQRREPGWALGRSPIAVAGVPRGWVATARLAGATLQFPGTRLTSAGFAGDRVLPFADRNTGEAAVPATLHDVLDVRRYAVANNVSVGSPGDLTAFVVRTAALRSSGAGPADYRGEFVLTLTRIAVAAVLPVEVGATFTDGAYRLRIERIAGEEGGLRMFGRASDVRTIFDRAPQPVYYFFLRNRRLSEAVEASVFRNRVVLGAVYPRTSPFHTSGWEMFFGRTAMWPEYGEWQLDDAWLRDAELVIVRTVANGMVSRTLEVTGVNVASD